MDQDTSFELLGYLTSSTRTRVDDKMQILVFERLVLTLRTHLTGGAVSKSISPASHLELFVRLQSFLPSSSVLDDALASAISECLPPFYDGSLSSFRHSFKSDSTTIHEFLEHSKSCWDNRLNKLPMIDIERFLRRDTWTDAVVQIVPSLIYAQPSTRRVVWERLAELGDNVARNWGVEGVAKVVLALIDTSDSDEGSVEWPLENIIPAYRTLIKTLTISTPPSFQNLTLCSQCVSGAVIRYPSLRSRLLTIIGEEISAIPKTLGTIFHLFTAVRRVLDSVPRDDEVKRVAEALVDRGLVWAVEELSTSTLDDEGC